MLPSDMNFKIKTGTVRYNNKILISDGKFSLGKTLRLMLYCYENLLSPKGVMLKIKSHKDPEVIAQQTHTHELAKKPTHEEEKIALILFLTGGSTIWFLFR